MNEMSMSEARKALATLTDEMTTRSPAVAITRRGKPVLAVMNWELYESIVETLEVMADDEMAAALRASLREVAQGRTVPSAKVAKDLGL
ncbi:MAG: type II toxin-antitoxin system Phd/YefM family antitoxin [Proteobacteria bacterium]|jgi:PHD/YefM family antitoxin component YafN of YafNO toxin-antitoxin module|nr:type II toxin-antitoxin system Phd/YefM family antitoxin [Pseudomonadota bacterium]